MAQSIKPCCALLRQYAETPQVLSSPTKTQELFQLFCEHCTHGQLKMQDKKGDCYLENNPIDAQAILYEAQKTAAAYQLDETEQLNAINKIITQNIIIKTIEERGQLFLKDMREKEKGENKFGRVPETDLLDKSKSSNHLNAGDLLKAHPLLADKPQFDGINPKDTSNPQQNPEAEENAKEIQLRLQNQPKNQYQNQYQNKNRLQNRPL